jgi:hypothetical protein
MKYIVYSLVTFFAVISLFSGCMPAEPACNAQTKIEKIALDESQPAVNIQGRQVVVHATPSAHDSSKIVFKVLGEGVAPKKSFTKAQQKILAKRAAIADAYRQLGEKLYGVKVTATDTVKDAALKNSNIVTTVDGVLKNSNITHVDYSDNIYKVAMELSINKRTWLEKFAY